VSCYLCGYEGYRTRKEGVRDNPEINVLECSKCGLVYLSHFEYTPDRVHKLVRNLKSWYRATENDDTRRAKHLKDITKGKAVLDFGCGNGGFLRKVVANSVCGIEIDRKAKQFCKDNGLDTFNDLDEVGKFDVITMFHVIEHLPDPISTLKEMAKHLNKKGMIVVETPNANDALITLYHCKDFEEFTYWSEHPFLYSHVTLKKVAEEAGYVVKEMSQYQRYPLANHLYWMSHGKPNGHNVWSFIQDDKYAEGLASIKKCDTIVAIMEKL